MFKPTVRTVVLSAVALTGLAVAGCEVHVYGPPPPPPPAAVVTVGGPVVDGGVYVDLAPPPDQRQYVYEVGFPPGVYFYNGFYYYNGYRYPHDVFVHRYVDVNIRDHRFTDVAANRREGAAIEARQRADFAHNGGRHPERPEDHRDDHH